MKTLWLNHAVGLSPGTENGCKSVLWKNEEAHTPALIRMILLGENFASFSKRDCMNAFLLGSNLSWIGIIFKQECIPVGCVPPTHWPYLVVSYAHPPQPCMPPPSNHTHTPATTHAHPPCGQNSWHTLLKILPYSKLRLRAGKISLIGGNSEFSSQQ